MENKSTKIMCNKGTYIWESSSYIVQKKLIKFFSKYPLLGNKRDDYIKFKTFVELREISIKNK